MAYLPFAVASSHPVSNHLIRIVRINKQAVAIHKVGSRPFKFLRHPADGILGIQKIITVQQSDYIPCICWGRNARFAGGFNVGERCEVWGRIQSREYMKKVGEEQLEKRIAYEVSVSKLELIEE